MTNRTPPDGGKDLRARAEAQLAATPVPAPADALTDALRLLHELQVHQVELQLQNEELQAARHTLTLALARQRVLYDEAPVGYCTLDAEGSVLEANRSVATLLDHPMEEIRGRHLSDFMTPDSALALHALQRHTSEWPTVHGCEITLDGGSPGQPQPARTIQVEARHETAGQGTLLALIDVSARKEALAQRHRAEIAERANEAKSMFFAQMNHELRTPLNAILGFSHMLRTQHKVELGDELKGWVDRVYNAGMHTLALVSDGLDLARIEAGRIDATLEPVVLEDALHEALALVEPMAAEAGIGLECMAPPDIPQLALANPRLLQQVLLNLLSNAIKYNRPRGRVVVTLHQEAGRAVVDVADTGAGLSQEQMTHLFRPFDRLGAELGGIEGTGLGLLISRRLAEAMGGSLTLRSVVGAGTTATLVLEACG